MGSRDRYQKLACKTLDGTILRGWFYAVDRRAPAIIMSHGFNCTKEILITETAEAFQSMGYNTLIYDPRNIGESEGLPRNEINPLQQAEDLSDILTYVSTLPSVDAGCLLLWGLSFGAAVSACAVAVDRRVKALVLVAPIFDFVNPEKRKSAFALLIKDRQSQLRGNPRLEVPPYNDKGENFIGMGGSGGLGGMEGYMLTKQAMERGAPNFRDRITLQTYHKLAMFRPRELLDMVEEVPVLMIIPELDDISTPAQQREAFERLKCPKRLHFAKGKKHLTILSGEDSEQVLDVMAEFFRQALEGTVN
ncbi:Nn.00g118150.m01.CDS01 [Neocucurbitaria sp. VM-36]